VPARRVTPREESVELVLIARDFLAAHRLLRQVAREHRDGSLAFHRVRSLIGDDEGSVLYRLKEHCHARFRPDEGVVGGVGAEALFDLAVGSLFHEAMKFRENFYQRDAYGPKIEGLRQSDLPEAELLRTEFEKILADAAVRTDESLAEAETLLAQTGQVFRVLLRANAESGLLTRYVLEHIQEITDALGIEADEILSEIHGSPAMAWRRGAESYLASGFFAEAAAALQKASARHAATGGDAESAIDPLRLGDYAQGMQAYLEGRYVAVLDHLEAWFDTGSRGRDAALVGQAHSAVSRLARADSRPSSPPPPDRRGPQSGSVDSERSAGVVSTARSTNSESSLRRQVTALCVKMSSTPSTAAPKAPVA
jgi:hypothetical protein